MSARIHLLTSITPSPQSSPQPWVDSRNPTPASTVRIMMIRPLLAAFLAFCTAIALAQDNTPPTLKVVLPRGDKAGTKVKAMVEIPSADGLQGCQIPASGEYQIPVVLS